MLNLKHSCLLRFLHRVHSYLFFTCLLYCLFSLERPNSVRGYLGSFGACQALKTHFILPSSFPCPLVHRAHSRRSKGTQKGMAKYWWASGITNLLQQADPQMPKFFNKDWQTFANILLVCSPQENKRSPAQGYKCVLLIAGMFSR